MRRNVQAGPILVAVILGLLCASSSAYGQLPAYKREAKRIKKALVRVEWDHDDVSAELDRLRDGLFSLDERIAAETQAPDSVDTSGSGLRSISPPLRSD